jgi:hypothetical protein
MVNQRSVKMKYACAQSKCNSAQKKYAQKCAHAESKCMASKNEIIQQLNEWVFELDNKRKATDKNQQSAEKIYMHAKCNAYLQLHKFCKERLARKEAEDI